MTVLSGLLFLGTGCGPTGAPPPAPAPRANVIFVLVDTLRADHTGFLGYERPTTPFLDELAAESIVFERARAQAGCTFPSMNSILTSRYPFDFYSRGPGEMGIPEQYPSIADILKAHGYSTAAVSASPIVRSTPSKHNPSAGFGRGFDVFDETCLWKPADCVNKRAETLLSNLEEPFFLYLHYMDPHDPYSPPSDFNHRFTGTAPVADHIAAGDPNPIAEMLYDEGPAIDFDEADIDHLRDLYDEEISYFDDRMRDLVGGLRDSGLLDSSILVVTSDHGEEFLEHGHLKHCRGVWDTLTRVPLLVRFPDGWGAKRVPGAVELVDLLPTLLDAIGLPQNGVEMEGVSLLPPIFGVTSSSTIAHSDQERYRSVDDGRYHLILDGLKWHFELFDTEVDPLEQRDLLAAEPEVGQTLQIELESWLNDSGQWEHFEMTLRAAKQHEDQLRALGYLE